MRNMWYNSIYTDERVTGACVRMKKFNFVGAVAAAVILVLALVAKGFGGENTAKIMLPILTLALAALCVIDSAAYKRERRSQTLIRAVMMGIMGIILAVASVAVLFF